jgi:hypothetical protein
MKVVMILGMPQVNSCDTGTGLRMPWDAPLLGAGIYPIEPREEVRLEVEKDSLDPDDWMKLPAVRCRATQSVLMFLFGLDGWAVEKGREGAG